MSTPLRDLPDDNWDHLMRHALHDLRTPLTTLLGYSKLILGKKSESNHATKLALEAQRSAVQMDAFLDFLALRSNHLSSVFREVDVVKILDRSVQWAAQQQPKKSFVFQPKEKTTGLIIGDEHQLSSLFMNVLLYLSAHYYKQDALFIDIALDKQVVITVRGEHASPTFHANSEVPTDLSFILLFVEGIIQVHLANIRWDTSIPDAPSFQIIFDRAQEE